MESEKRVIVALDVETADEAREIVAQLGARAAAFKIGLQLFTAAGPEFVRELAADHRIFLDLKFHDIPNTVAQACKAAARLGVWMLNVHALGGRAMMEAARNGIEAGGPRPHLIAVTILTSMTGPDLAEVGVAGSPLAAALKLAGLAAECGLDGVVCSAHEAGAIRDRTGERFLRVTPGIRLAEDGAGDQKRIMTPRVAMDAGASYLVIGRSVTRAADPLAVLARINLDTAIPETTK